MTTSTPELPGLTLDHAWSRFDKKFAVAMAAIKKNAPTIASNITEDTLKQWFQPYKDHCTTPRATLVNISVLIKSTVPKFCIEHLTAKGAHQKPCRYTIYTDRMIGYWPDPAEIIKAPNRFNTHPIPGDGAPLRQETVLKEARDAALKGTPTGPEERYVPPGVDRELYLRLHTPAPDKWEVEKEKRRLAEHPEIKWVIGQYVPKHKKCVQWLKEGILQQFVDVDDRVVYRVLRLPPTPS